MNVLYDHQAELRMRIRFRQENERRISELSAIVESHGLVPWGKAGFQPNDCYRVEGGHGQR